MSHRPLLQVENARVERDGTVILAVDSLRFNEGEHVAVLGPNGAGKSTLIGLLTRDVMPLWVDPPPVRFFGRERMPLTDVRRVLGVVSATWQDVVGVHLPVREVVLGGRFGTLGLPRHLAAAVTAEDEAAAEAALAEIGIAALAERDMRTLSTGEARRALIARALVHDPAIVVLDEPCAGLDPTAAFHLRELMRQMAAGGRTLVLVTHHIEDVIAAIDRVVMMKDGAIIADGPKSDVLTSEGLSATFGVPLELEEREGEYRLW